MRLIHTIISKVFKPLHFSIKIFDVVFSSKDLDVVFFSAPLWLSCPPFRGPVLVELDVSSFPKSSWCSKFHSFKSKAHSFAMPSLFSCDISSSLASKIKLLIILHFFYPLARCTVEAALRGQVAGRQGVANVLNPILLTLTRGENPEKEIVRTYIPGDTGCSLNIVFFPWNFVIFLNAVSSAVALVFYLPVVCTHTDTEGKQSSEYF